MLASVLLAGPAFAQADSIFREISIAPHGTIALGEPFQQAGEIGRRLQSNVYLLPPGFGGTKGIVVVLGPEGRVIALLFEYTGTETYDEMVSGYRTMLGSSEERITTSSPSGTGAPSGVCTSWNDGRTLFEVFWSVDDGGLLLSMMNDLGGNAEPDACLISTYYELGKVLAAQNARSGM